MTPALRPSCHTPAKQPATMLVGAAVAGVNRPAMSEPTEPAASAVRNSRRVAAIVMGTRPFVWGGELGPTYKAARRELSSRAGRRALTPRTHAATLPP